MSPENMLFANIFLFIFLFGLVFTVVSVMLGASHLGVGGHDASVGAHQLDLGGAHGGHAGDLGHIGGHLGDIGHGAHAGHVDGQGIHIGHADTAGQAGSHHADIHLGGHDAEVGDAFPVLNMPTIMAFLTWFGGAGYIVTRLFNTGPLFSVPLASLSGLTGGTIMFMLLARVLWPMRSKPMSTAEFSLPGTPARVVSSIRAGGVGEIVYSKGGSRFTAGARAVDEQPIPKGAEVVILRYEHGLAYVQVIDSLLSQV